MIVISTIEKELNSYGFIALVPETIHIDASTLQLIHKTHQPYVSVLKFPQFDDETGFVHLFLASSCKLHQTPHFLQRLA